VAEIGEEVVKDVAHCMRDACEPRQRAGVILTHKPGTTRDIGYGDGREPALDPRSAQTMFSEIQLVQSAPPAGTIQRQINHCCVRENLGLGLPQPDCWNQSVGEFFYRQPAYFCKREATDRAPAGSTRAGRGKPKRSRRVFVS
jgi:hypothetical protein